MVKQHLGKSQIGKLKFREPLLPDQAVAHAKGWSDQRVGQLHGLDQSAFDKGTAANIRSLGQHLYQNLTAQGKATDGRHLPSLPGIDVFDDPCGVFFSPFTKISTILWKRKVIRMYNL